MNQFSDPPEDEPEGLPDPNAELDTFAEESAAEAEPAQAAAPELSPAEQENQQLRQRLAQIEQAQLQTQQQMAAQEIQRWITSAPEAERPQRQYAVQSRLGDAQREAEDKQRVMWTIAQRNGLQGQYLQEFYEEATAVFDPLVMEHRTGPKYKRLQELEAKPEKKERPGMARTRPDAGAPQGQRGTGRATKEQVLAPFMPGGPKQGKLEEMDLVLQQHGYYR